jgi:hypothetical protein
MKYDFIVGSFQLLNNLKPCHMRPGVKIARNSQLPASLSPRQVHTPGSSAETGPLMAHLSPAGGIERK